MIALISLLVPLLVMTCLRKEKLKKDRIYGNFIDYIFCLLALNFFMMLILCYGFGSKDNLFLKLNQYNNFAVKYILLSTVLAILEPYIEKFIKEKIIIENNFKLKKYSNIGQWKLIVGFYAAILFMLNFIRIFDNSFWGDETFTIWLIKKPISEIISETALDVHPPLYYLFVKLAYVMFGNSAWVFHLVSLIPCAIIMLLSITVFWRQFGKEFSIIMITLSCLSSNAVCYNMEVRMYSWGSLFILLCYYELYHILQKENKRSYLLFVIFSLAAAYVHYYCLIAVAFLFIVLLYLAFCRKQLNAKKVTLSCICTILGYLPWALVLLKSIQRVKDNYWITEIPTIKQSVEYLFSNHFCPVIWGGTVIGGLCFLLYEIRVLEIGKKEEGIFC